MPNDVVMYEQKPLSAVEIRAQVNLIQEVMKSVMQDGHHFGTIPGCKQPSLYKPGAEKLMSTFKLSGDPEVDDLSTNDVVRYRVRVVVKTYEGREVGYGVGECSSDEAKYRWRSAVCKEEFDETPDDRKRKTWKKGGQGRPNYQVEQVRTDPADVANTVLKMAKKRALIDAVLTTTAASDIFTQDIEDLPDGLEIDGSTGEVPPQTPQPRADAPPVQVITEKQAGLLEMRLKNAGLSRDEFKAAYKIEHMKDLPFSAMNSALEWIDKNKKA